MAWFVWNGQDSRDFNIWISELPQPTRAAERVEEVTVIGRAGTLLIKEGDNVHGSYLKECAIVVPYTCDMHAILDWLHGSGEVIFSNDPGRVYFADIPNEIKFSRDGNSLRTAVIPFFVHPHAGQWPPETAIAYSADGTIYNPGTVAAKPKIEITFTGSCTLAIGDTEIEFTDVPVGSGQTQPEITITVDCDAQIITDEDGIWAGTADGDFFLIPPGTSEIDLTNCTISILPRWRWF